MREKNFFRNAVKQKVLDSGEENLSERSTKVISQLKSLPHVSKASVIMLYHPLFDEVNLLALAREGLENGQRVCFPVCVHQDRTIIIREVTSLENDFSISSIYNLHEPHDSCPEIAHEDVDSVVVPGRAFDKLGNRVGRGKGYYDNFLKSTHFVKIAASFSFQLFDNVPSDSHDIPLDYIVTEDTVITCTVGVTTSDTTGPAGD